MGDEAGDYDGLFDLNPKLVEKLQRFLHKKEADLADAILQAFLPQPSSILPSLPIPDTHTDAFRLPEMLDPLEKAVRSYCESTKSFDRQANWNNLRTALNKELWDYVELLEGCASELYDQLSQVSFEQWRLDLYDTVKKIQNELLNRIEDLMLVIKRLEHVLWEFRAWKQSTPSARSILDRFQFWFTVTLDAGLKDNLNKTEEFLRLKFKDFSDRYAAYDKIDPQISGSLEKYGKFLIIKNLEQDHQDKIVLLSVLLHCWELAQKSYKNLIEDVKQSVFRSVNINRATGLLREYYRALHKALYDTSRAFKGGNFATVKSLLADSIKLLREEAQSLKSTVAVYRNFIGSIDAEQGRELVRISYDLQNLDAQFARMSQAIEYAEDPEQVPYQASLHKEIESLLHSMGQPLISRKIMRSQVQRLLPLLQDCNELGSCYDEASVFVGEMLTKALRADWKTQVLQEHPAFHELVAQHNGIFGQVDDRAHSNRMGKFKRIVHHIEHWVKEGVTYRHIGEIEVDMNDIKEVLQDYLATVQRFVKDGMTGEKSVMNGRGQKLAHMLLEYRYLFGNFYYFLRKHSTEGEYIRNQFQYIEKYFEAVEHQLNIFKSDQRVRDEGSKGDKGFLFNE